MDLGTTSVQVAVRGRGIVLEEPSVVAVDRRTGKILEVGQAARQMLGRTPGELVAVRPLEQGYIADCTMAEEMVSAFLRKALPRRLFKPRLLLCVPSGSAEVAERAVVEAGVRAGARKVYLMEEPLAAALGAGIDIRQPQGHMVVDIGGGTTDVAVTALGGVVASACLATAGDQFDQALIQYVRQHHDLLIGARTAQAVKEAIGQVAGEGEESAAVKGRCLTSGLPRQITLTAQETAEAFAPVAEVIVAAVHRVLERTPPETGRFGTLGHGISDVDTAVLMKLQRGAITPASIAGVVKGVDGRPGELRGSFSSGKDLGTLYANTTCGVFGHLTNAAAQGGTPVPVALPQQVHTGPATIRSNVSGTQVEEYTVEILKVYEHTGDSRDLMLKVTDPRLLAQTGGIVQGMSGSPILQDGKLVGAVTHVLIDHADRGYGIFAQRMLEQADRTRSA